ncbi:GGDEF domain-containing response regulator [Thiohalorhabdus sp.]|uniref:GGDEF domain-containing response regulator n=1 Tax=Thiohalorhabdus sp. TaxID=3094134 RepID=UPI002FC34153
MEAVHLLLIEDSPADADLIQAILAARSDAPYRIQRATTLAEGIGVAQEQTFDAVLLDLNLPDAQGLTTIRAWLEGPGIRPVIVMTGQGGEEMGPLAIQEGAQDYLTKDELGPALGTRIIDQARERWALGREQRIMAVAFHTGQATLVTDAEGIIERANPAFTQITGYTASEVIGRNPRLLSSGTHDPAFYQALWRQLLEEGHWQGEIWNRHKDGHLMPVWQTITAVTRENGEVEHFVSVFHDISEQKRLEAEMARLAATDSLTGLANRRHFLEAARSELHRSFRHGLSFSLLMADADHFKAINDHYGHETGDLVLKTLAKVLETNLREEEVVGRIGGEEFAILLPETDHQGAETVAERLRALVAGTPIPTRSGEISITISLGMAGFQGAEDTVDGLLARADQQLYVAKEAGRNRVGAPPAG